MPSLGAQLLVVLCVNALLVMGQFAMNEYAVDMGEENTTFLACGSSLLANFGNCSTLSVNQDAKSSLPTGTPGGVDPTTGNIFTDIFNSILNWFLEIPAVGFIWSLVSAPVTLLSAIGVDRTFAFIVGSLWYGYTLFIIISFLWGRQGE